MPAGLAHAQERDLGDVDAASLPQSLDRGVDEVDGLRVGDTETLGAGGQRVLIIALVESIDGKAREASFGKALGYIALMFSKAVTFVQNNHGGNEARSPGHRQISGH